MVDLYRLTSRGTYEKSTSHGTLTFEQVQRRLASDPRRSGTRPDTVPERPAASGSASQSHTGAAAAGKKEEKKKEEGAAAKLPTRGTGSASGSRQFGSSARQEPRKTEGGNQNAPDSRASGSHQPGGLPRRPTGEDGTPQDGTLQPPKKLATGKGWMEYAQNLGDNQGNSSRPSSSSGEEVKNNIKRQLKEDKIKRQEIIDKVVEEGRLFFFEDSDLDKKIQPRPSRQEKKVETPTKIPYIPTEKSDTNDPTSDGESRKPISGPVKIHPTLNSSWDGGDELSSVDLKKVAGRSTEDEKKVAGRTTRHEKKAAGRSTGDEKKAAGRSSRHENRVAGRERSVSRTGEGRKSSGARGATEARAPASSSNVFTFDAYDNYDAGRR